MAVKVDLRNTIAAANFLVRKSNNTLERIGDKTITHLIRQWIRGIGGNGMTLQRPSINRGYKTFKESLGNIGMIDMVLHGSMSRSLHTKKVDDNKYSVTFSRSEMKKASSNYKLRPQYMKLSDRFKRDMIIFYLKELRSSK